MAHSLVPEFHVSDGLGRIGCPCGGLNGGGGCCKWGLGGVGCSGWSHRGGVLVDGCFLHICGGSCVMNGWLVGDIMAGLVQCQQD